MRTHKHTDLTDSSTALIADLNRPGDLSLSLTHTRHTSFFPPSQSSPSSPLLFLLPKYPLLSTPCRFASIYFYPPLYLPQKWSAFVYHCNTGDDFLPRMLMAICELWLTVRRHPCAYNRAPWWEAQGNLTVNHLKHLS